jgi:hypothetical protein
MAVLPPQQYYSLYINNTRFKIRYIDPEKEDYVEAIFDDNLDFAIAWVEPMDRKQHYFWFRLLAHSYVLNAHWSARKGMDNHLRQVDSNQRELNFDTVRNVFRWRDNHCGVTNIYGNEATDGSYQKTIMKTEGLGLH